MDAHMASGGVASDARRGTGPELCDHCGDPLGELGEVRGVSADIDDASAEMHGRSCRMDERCVERRGNCHSASELCDGARLPSVGIRGCCDGADEDHDFVREQCINVRASFVASIHAPLEVVHACAATNDARTLLSR
jgi:hypothetical protein